MSCKSSINSSKVSVILSALKLTVESFGKAESSRGGKVSRGPPCGGIILAQPDGIVIQKQEAVMDNKKLNK